jgi:DNA (cytosine-5)-methyltransferase 1
LPVDRYGRPVEVVPGGRLQLLVASPECTHHSNARGGKPRSDQKRADAWLLMKWINDLYIENILIENVKEFESWGPLTAKGSAGQTIQGRIFQAVHCRVEDQLHGRISRAELCGLWRSDNTGKILHSRSTRT